MKKIKYFFRKIKEKDFLISISYFLFIQGMIYFCIKLFQSNYHEIHFVFDSKIPFIPYFVYIYNLFYPFMFLSLYYIYCKDKKTYKMAIIAGTIGYLICDIIFLLYPTIMIRPDISNINMDFLTSLVLNITYFYDNPPLNCLPSIHVLFSFQVIITTIMSKNIKKKYKLFIIFLSLLIAVSTLFVKQHYIYDVIAAIIICIFANLIVYIINKYLKRK